MLHIEAVSGPRRASDGLTLIDILVALVVTALLVSLAFPSYRGYVTRSQRAQAVRVLLETAACQERLRAGSRYYDTTRCASHQQAEGYRFETHPQENTEALEYRILAIPLAEGVDDGCGTLSLDHLGTRGASRPDRINACWGGR